MIVDFKPGDIFRFGNGEMIIPILWGGDYLFLGYAQDLATGHSNIYKSGKRYALDYLNKNDAKLIGVLSSKIKITENNEKEDISVWGFNKK